MIRLNWLSRRNGSCLRGILASTLAAVGSHWAAKPSPTAAQRKGTDFADDADAPQID